MALRQIAIFAVASFLATCSPVEESVSRQGRQVEWDSSPGFWIWNRPEALTNESFDELKAVNSTRLYWQVAEVFPDGKLSRITDSGLVAHLHEISATPVIRLAPGAETIGAPKVIAAIRLVCADLFDDVFPRRIQLDYDCPTSSLKEYADFVIHLRDELGIDKLSVTALASWIDAPGFRALATSVDELVPMFYDLEPDTPAGILAGDPVPMLSKTTLRWIGKWNRCPAAWRAGLPNFQRLTIFEPDGSLVGHHRSWSPELLLSHPDLKLSSSQPGGITRFQVTADANLFGTAITKGQQLLWRMPDESLATLAIEAARESGASGTVWFAHPDSAPVAWHSVTHLTAIQRSESTAPDPGVSVSSDGAVVLTNRGPGDLPPRAVPWQLVLETETPGQFGTADPGSFSFIDSPGASLAQPEFSRKIVLRFQSLRAGDELRSGSGLILSSGFHQYPSPPDGTRKPPHWKIIPAP